MAFGLFLSALAVTVNIHYRDTGAQVITTHLKSLTPAIQNTSSTHSPSWTIDFSTIQLWLFSLELTPETHLVVDQVLLEVFNRIHSQGLIPQQQVQHERLYFLISRTLPAPANTQFIDIFKRYQKYQLALDKLYRSKKPSSIEGQMEALLQRQYMQIQYFTESYARLLFSKTNNIHTYLLKRRLIIENNALSDSQKTTALTLLKADYDT